MDLSTSNSAPREDRVEAVLDLDVGERLIRVDLQEHVTDA